MIEQINEDVEQNKKILAVYYSYFKWFIGAATLATIASIISYFFNIYNPFTNLQIKIIQIFSLVLEAATLGQCGYSIQTWGGVSPAEKLNERLFSIFAIMGFFFIIFSFQLETALSAI